MKRYLNRITVFLCILLIALSSATTAFAHSGRTDSSGGHRDNKNKSGLGSYHYHCGGYPAHLHVDGYCPYRDVFPSSVTVKSEKNALGIGESVTLTASVYPNNSCNSNVTWSCSDPAVLSLSDGVITAKNYGTATVTAETFNGKRGTYKITVKEITADKVSISGLPDSSEYYIGDEFILSAVITPENVDNPAITWSSSNEQVATVSQSGQVNLLSEGQAEIIATASNGVSGKVTIASQERYVDAVEIADNEVEIFVGQDYTLNAKVIPENATYPTLTWAADNSDIVSVSEAGVITALASGEANITATSKNGVSDSVLVTVHKVIDVEEISIKASTEKSISKGETILFDAEVLPEDATYPEISWSVSDPEIASIDDNGMLTALKSGRVTVVATSADGISAEYNVTIQSPISTIIICVIIVGVVAAVFIAIKKKRK